MKRKIGTWVFIHDGEYTDEYWVCSVCGLSALNDYKGRSTPSNFCPHCGKPMIIETKEVKQWDCE